MAQGIYGATTSLLQMRFGTASILAWSDTENTKVLNDARVQMGIDNADADINRMFLDNGGYTIPLVPLGTDVTTVMQWELGLAGCWLYFLRGITDDTEVNRYEALRQEIYADMRSAASNGGRLNAARRWPSPTGPSW